MINDYIVKDSSLLPSLDAFSVYSASDCAIRVGMVRSLKEEKDDTIRYVVDVFYRGKQMPILCTMMTKINGAHNYEEYNLRPWNKTGAPIPTSAATSTYDLRAGDIVLVAFLDGQGREGVILGGVTHPSRPPRIQEDEDYVSEVNGVKTVIKKDGSYKIEFQGKPVNSVQLDIPPAGQPTPPPVYNPLIAGSRMGFKKGGSFFVKSGTQYISLKKGLLGGETILSNGSNNITLTHGTSLDEIGISNLGNVSLSAAQAIDLRSLLVLRAQALETSIYSPQVAIGTPAFELIDGLIQILEGLGDLTITSPVGTCTPFNLAPQWAAKILPLLTLMKTMKVDLEETKEAAASSDDDLDI
jgi:hypothetical protein